ncbi:MAG: efflux RND transporter periplasmic adaptor subunit [Bryobacteraceae bacterium]|nr:efflux RND transporter periplasmic adaptor subunit [Bryobacteraceae bacterium]
MERIYLILAAAALTACGPRGSQTPVPASPPITVNTVAVEAFDAPPAITSTASFAATEAAELGPETEGVVREVYVRLGDSVSAGQPLLQLETKEAQWRLDEALARAAEAEAAVRQAEARVGPDGPELTADVLNAQSAVDSAEEDARLAASEAARAERLWATKDISQSSYDRARSASLNAQARLRGARQQLAAARNGAQQAARGIDVARAQRQSAQAQVSQARKRVADTVLRAPFAGVVTGRSISVGEFAGPQSKLVRLEKVEPLKLVFTIPEPPGLIAGLPVEARVAAWPGEVFRGKLRTPNGSLDAASRALTVEAEFANPGHRLKPGYFADARILLGGAERALRLPAAALDFDPRTETYRVWCYQQGQVKLHLVAVPRKQGPTVELRAAEAAGLTAGTRVVLSPPPTLYDGMAASLRQEIR